jgi:hypothetical protein
MTEWELHGLEFGNCNCAYSCPCQFNALPTDGTCRAIGFFRVDKGHFGKTRLDGLKMAFAVRWPRAVHQGHGQMQPIIDVKADTDQRKALLSIMTGKETDEMATFFAVYTAMCEKVHDPVYSEIRIDADMKARSAKCEGRGRRIRSGTADPQSGHRKGAPRRHRIAERIRVHAKRGRARLVGIIRRRWHSNSKTATPIGASCI